MIIRRDFLQRLTRSREQFGCVGAKLITKFHFEGLNLVAADLQATLQFCDVLVLLINLLFQELCNIQKSKVL